MRLAKYGKQIRENYRAFKNKQNVDPQSKEFSSQSVPNVVNTSPDLTQQRKKHDEHLAELDFTPPGADPEVMECSAYREAMKRILRENKAASSAQRAKSPKELGTIEKLAQSFSRSRVLSADGAGASSQSDTVEIQDEAESPKSEIAKKLGAIKKVFQPPTEKRSKRKEEVEHQPGTSYGSVQEVLHFIPDQRGIENESLLTEEDDFEHEFVSPVAQSAALERESIRSRVAMDFTGKQGRIVDDPVEANEIALAEGYMWKRRHKIANRRTANTKPNENHVDVGIHTVQPWFHSNLSRDQASTLVTRYGDGDGVFIVRPSRTSEGTFVLTYKCQGKLVHQQIVPMTDRERNITVFTLDSGQTKFYDILQLVEFYTVNLGPLMCRLTHYITENANINNPSISTPSNTPEYVNVAVNTDITIHNPENANPLESPSGSSKTTSSPSLHSRCSPN